MSPCSHGADPLSSSCRAGTVLPACSLTGSTVLSTRDSRVQYCGAVSTSRGGHWTVPGSPAPAVMADPISAPTTEESTAEAAVVEGGAGTVVGTLAVAGVPAASPTAAALKPATSPRMPSAAKATPAT